MGDTPTLVHATPLFVQHCYKCGVLFAVPADFEARRREDNRTFWCPNGHGQCYPRRDDPAAREHRRRVVLESHEFEQAEARQLALVSRMLFDGSAVRPLPLSAREPDGEPRWPDNVKVLTLEGAAARYDRPTQELADLWLSVYGRKPDASPEPEPQAGGSGGGDVTVAKSGTSWWKCSCGANARGRRLLRHLMDAHTMNEADAQAVIGRATAAGPERAAGS